MNQIGFRKGMETQIFVAKLMERINEIRGNKWVIFVDITKAYDSIKRNQVEEELEKIIPETWVELYSEITQGMTATRNGIAFEYRKGLPQGSIFSPMMFALIYQKAIAMIKQQGVEIYAYADDLALIAKDTEEIEKIKECF